MLMNKGKHSIGSGDVRKTDQGGFNGHGEVMLSKRRPTDLRSRESSSSDDGDAAVQMIKKLYKMNDSVKRQQKTRIPVPGSQEKMRQKMVEDRGIRVICRDYVKGNCNNPVCQFVHDISLYPCLRLYSLGFCDNRHHCQFNHQPFQDESDINHFISDNLQYLVDAYKSKKTTPLGYYFFKYLYGVRSNEPYNFAKLNVMIPKQLPPKLPPHLLIPQDASSNTVRSQPSIAQQSSLPANSFAGGYFANKPTVGHQSHHHQELVTPTKAMAGGQMAVNANASGGGESLLNSLKVSFYSPKQGQQSTRAKNVLINELTPPTKLNDDKGSDYFDTSRSKYDYRRSTGVRGFGYAEDDRYSMNPGSNLKRDRSKAESKIGEIFARGKTSLKHSKSEVDHLKARLSEKIAKVRELAFGPNYLNG